MENKPESEKIYILNPNYVLKNDINRIILTYKEDKSVDNAQDTTVFIHPMHAMMLSFFNGNEILKTGLEKMSTFFGISVEKSYELVHKFISNPRQIAVEYDNNFFYFPKNILTEKNNEQWQRTYNVDDFVCKLPLDFESKRLNIPIGANILINNKCVTNCIYCYADKRVIHDCTIPFDRLKEIIREAKSLGFVNFDIQGGELFLYEHWYDLVKEFLNCGFTPFISTKCPLKKSDIDRLKDLGIEEIQISLDSIYEEDLMKNLRVGTKYHAAMMNSVRLANDANLKIKLKPVITAPIFDIRKITDYLEYFDKFENVHFVEITVPSHSIYKSQEEFFEYRLSLTQIREIEKSVEEKRISFTFV